MRSPRGKEPGRDRRPRLGLGRRVALLAIAAAGLANLGHVNSPHIYLEENVGPYSAIVIAHMPPAVPGEIELQIRLSDRATDDDVSVRVREIPPQGEEYAADWVTAKRSEIDPDFYESPVPLVLFGLWHVEIEATGDRGTGVMRFPVPARIPVPRRMTPVLLTSLIGLMALVYFTQWQIVRGLARDGRIAPGGTVDDKDRRRGKIGAWIAVAVLSGALAIIGVQWWYLHTLYDKIGGTALGLEAIVRNAPPIAGKRLDVELRIQNRRGEPPQDLAPDHGKMMHLVVAEQPGGELLLHVHPIMTQPGVFRFRFEPPRPGAYALFAGILHATGESETVTATLEVEGTATGRPHPGRFDDPEDSYAERAPFGELPDDRESDVGDGLTMRWTAPDGPIERGEFHKLDFELVGADGEPVAAIEPYLGMAGRMLVLRDDFDVFNHNHPMGTIGGRMAMLMNEGHVDSAADAPVALPPRATFPYGFPSPGRYRLWIQMKREGRVYTGVFDTTVR